MEKELGILYRQIGKKHRDTVQGYLDGFNLYIGQPRFLFELEKSPGISQTELTERLDVSKETVSVTLKRLEHTEFIERLASDEDKRCKLLYLSEKGMAVVGELKKNFNHINNGMFASLSSNDQETAIRLMKLMLEGLEGVSNHEDTI